MKDFLSIRSVQDVPKIEKELMEIAQFIFAKSQQNLLRPMGWGDDRHSNQGRKPRTIVENTTGAILIQATPPHWTSQGIIEFSYDSPHSKWVEFGCFFDKNTLILTKNGEIELKDLRLGDEIKTETGYKKLIQKERMEIGYPICEIVVETKSGKKINITEDHPIKTKEGWKEAKFLNVGDIVYTEDGI